MRGHFLQRIGCAEKGDVDYIRTYDTDKTVHLLENPNPSPNQSITLNRVPVYQAPTSTFAFRRQNSKPLHLFVSSMQNSQNRSARIKATQMLTDALQPGWPNFRSNPSGSFVQKCELVYFSCRTHHGQRFHSPAPGSRSGGS